MGLFLKLLANWRLTAIVMALSAVLSGYAGWKTRDLFADSTEKSRLEAIIEAKQIDLDKKTAIATQAANRETALRESNRRLNDILDHETRDPAYRCAVPAGGLQAINIAVKQSNSGQLGAGMREGTGTDAK